MKTIISITLVYLLNISASVAATRIKWIEGYRLPTGSSFIFIAKDSDNNTIPYYCENDICNPLNSQNLLSKKGKIEFTLVNGDGKQAGHFVADKKSGTYTLNCGAESKVLSTLSKEDFDKKLFEVTISPVSMRPTEKNKNRYFLFQSKKPTRRFEFLLTVLPPEEKRILPSNSKIYIGKKGKMEEPPLSNSKNSSGETIGGIDLMRSGKVEFFFEDSGRGFFGPVSGQHYFGPVKSSDSPPTAYISLFKENGHHSMTSVDLNDFDLKSLGIPEIMQGWEPIAQPCETFRPQGENRSSNSKQVVQ